MTHSTFTITEADRAGIEKAAQWHVSEAEAYAIILQSHARETMQYELLSQAQATHIFSAVVLRRLLEPRSSAPESPVPEQPAMTDYLNQIEAAKDSDGAKTK